MKLSEAIRRGAKRRPQAFGIFFGFAGNGSHGGSCALAAACEGHWGMSSTYLLSDGGWDLCRIVQGPKQLPIRMRLLELIMILNDRLRWSREAIAEWVEMIEQKDEEERAKSRAGISMGSEDGDIPHCRVHGPHRDRRDRILSI